MPFRKKIELEQGLLGIWELTDSADSLIEVFQFSKNEEEEFKKFRFGKRQVEYLATRLLLQKLLNTKVEITYLQSGQPQIKNSNQNISVSHSANFVVILISDDMVGIDVENANRKIDKVVNRFLNPNELQWIEKSKQQQFLKILFWCAKEAIYKCSNQSGVLFETDILIPPFEFEKTDCFRGYLTSKNCTENYKLWYFYFENNIVVYCVEIKNNFT